MGLSMMRGANYLFLLAFEMNLQAELDPTDRSRSPN